MIITIGSQKGGVGKSTICCNMAAALAQQARDVIIVDSDSQRSASAWWAERTRSRPELPHIACVQKDGYINQTLEDFNARYGFVLVDAAGRDSDELRSAMAVSDVLITPTKCSQIDLMTLSTMAALIRKCAQINTRLISYCLLNIAPTNKRITEIEQARNAILEYQEIILLDTIISDRKIYRDSMADGSGVSETDGKAASAKLSREEIQQLVSEVLHGII